jgi:uncharacterized protein (DUF1778 family)
VAKKTYADMVKEAESVKGSGEEVEGLIPVRARVAKEPRMVRSVRMSASEYEAIGDAAKAAGVETGDFIRTAALAAARSGDSIIDRQKLRELWTALASEMRRQGF